MKKVRLVMIITMAVMALAACGGSTTASGADTAPTSSAPVNVGALTEEYEDALTIKNQLLLGTIRLEGTEHAITAAQAAQLVSLWSAMKSLTASGTAADEEIIALQNQIVALMTPEQLTAIATMQLTNEDSQTYYVEIGASTPTTPEPEATTGSMSDLSKEDRQATKVALGTPISAISASGKGTILLDNVIDMLKDKAA